LWVYHLNYFDFLNAGSLAAHSPEEQAAFSIMLDWCRANPQGSEIGWDPYPLSLRIVNWLKFLSSRLTSTAQGMNRPPTDFLGNYEPALHPETEELIRSVFSQVLTLECRLEKELLANHLLKNLKALLFAGALLGVPGAARWRAMAEELLERELAEQILPDGGHFERSPMYHAQVLEDLLEIQALYHGMGLKLPGGKLFATEIRAMGEFLEALLHPDGEIPLFNDSALGEVRAPAELIARARENAPAALRESRVTALPDTGYGVLRDPATRSALIFDCGPLGPDHQPGHAHCDVLSYELSLHGERVVVDTGVSTYAGGGERDYERSTAAHNTLRIDGEEQAELWGSFRVGRRPRVARLHGASTSRYAFVSGKHSAYRSQGVIHTRQTILYGRETWVIVDRLGGRGAHHVESFLHFHPNVRVEAASASEELYPENHRSSPTGLDVDLAPLPDAERTAQDVGANPAFVMRPNHAWKLEFCGHSYLLLAYGPGDLQLRNSWYAEQFGKREPSNALFWTARQKFPTGFIHVFLPATRLLPCMAVDWGRKSLWIDGTAIPLR